MKFAIRGRVLALVFAASIATIYVGPAFSAQSHLGVNPKDLVTLEWGCNDGMLTPTRRLTDGTRVENFQIPRKQLLVITDLEWRMLVGIVTPAINYIVEAQLSSPGALISHVYAGQLQLINSRGGFRSDHLTSGIVLDSSVNLNNDPFTPHPRFSLFGVALEGPAGNCVAILRGYLIRE